ncbi:hypothetical protein AGLY_006975 [Aphis glycines]|uniref:Uncharacterized protein n=1 Tax=Aphis glycines TaxID=307491 RepID=A0A6G0TQA7_APHGL|nr:hypothetical protein AGLY_006975 [Aphis glycines]
MCLKIDSCKPILHLIYECCNRNNNYYTTFYSRYLILSLRMNHCKVPLNKMKQFLRKKYTYIGSNIPNIIIYNVYPRFKLSLGVIIIHLLPNLSNYSYRQSTFNKDFRRRFSTNLIYIKNSKTTPIIYIVIKGNRSFYIITSYRRAILTKTTIFNISEISLINVQSGSIPQSHYLTRVLSKSCSNE